MPQSLRNLAVRVVGTYLRVNTHPNPSNATPARYRPALKIAELSEVAEGPAGYPTVATAMAALARELPGKGYDLELRDYPTAKLLDQVRFGPTGSQEPFILSARDLTASLADCQTYCPSGRCMIASWQYTLQERPNGPTVPLTGRTSYHESPPVEDGMAITWRLNIVHASPMSVAVRTRREEKTRAELAQLPEALAI